MQVISHKSQLMLAIIWHIIGAVLWISGIHWGIWALFSSDYISVSAGMAVAIVLSILAGMCLHFWGANMARDAFVDLDLANKQMEDRELQELRERLEQAEQKLDRLDTS